MFCCPCEIEPVFNYKNQKLPCVYERVDLPINPVGHTGFTSSSSPVPFSMKASTNENMFIERFVNELCVKWFEDIKFSSSSSEICQNRYCRKIIDIGFPAVPVLVKMLDGSSRFLLYVLHEITGINPVKTENYHNIPAMVKDWKDWWTSKLGKNIDIEHATPDCLKRF